MHIINNLFIYSYTNHTHTLNKNNNYEQKYTYDENNDKQIKSG